MTRAMATTMAPILAAYGRGEPVQWRWSTEEGTSCWTDAVKEGCSMMLDARVEWRVKPTPRTWWLLVDGNGVALNQGAFSTERDARYHRDHLAGCHPVREVVRVVEVLP